MFSLIVTLVDRLKPELEEYWLCSLCVVAGGWFSAIASRGEVSVQLHHTLVCVQPHAPTA
jgi:hypothetical protein